jgi:hypothetical protein
MLTCWQLPALLITFFLFSLPAVSQDESVTAFDKVTTARAMYAYVELLGITGFAALLINGSYP